MRTLLSLLCLLAFPAAALEHLVVIGPGLVYDPSQLTIAAGDTVRFTASDAHPLRSDTDIFTCFSECVIRFDAPGDYGYHCETHGVPGGAMHGTLRVQSTETIHSDGFEAPL